MSSVLIDKEEMLLIFFLSNAANELPINLLDYPNISQGRFSKTTLFFKRNRYLVSRVLDFLDCDVRW